MNVMIQTRDRSADREIREFTEGKGDRVFISHSTEESIEILSRATIDKAVVSLKALADAAILKHINDYYPDTEVVVIANKAFDELLSIFRKGNYSVIHEPLRLSELRTKLGHKGDPRKLKEQ